MFDDSLALVTGAGSGIGAAITLGLARRGARVVLVGRSLEKLESVAVQAGERRAALLCHASDLAVDADLSGVADLVHSRFDRLHTLVHSAGEFAMGETADAPVEDLDRQYRVNLRAPYLLTQKLLPLLRAARGKVVFVNSTAGLRARGGVGQYAATKHGLKALADSLREEENSRGVGVLSVYPGRTATPMQQEIFRLEGRPYRPEVLLQPEDVATAVIEGLALPATAEVTDLQVRPMKKP